MEIDSTMLTLTDVNFKTEVLEAGDEPVLVDFWATWCAPCRVMGPVLHEISKEYEGKIKVGKMDVDTNMRTATQYGIRSMPTFLIFKNGQVMDQVVGSVPKKALTTRIDRLVHAAV